MLDIDSLSESDDIWINPIGGLGDTLMLSGVLKLVVEKYPNARFNLARRTGYSSILKGHPAIKNIGFPPKGAKIIGTDYWSKEELGGGNQRAFQILARMFGLSTPVEEKLYLPEEENSDDLLINMIPWAKKNILIAPFSISPRKVMHPMIWHQIVEWAVNNGVFVLQAGRFSDMHIKNSYSLLGLSTPKQLASIMRICDLVITSDNFIMHFAHFVEIPAIVFWGPTSHEVYGYAEQYHFQSPINCDIYDKCLGTRYPENYSTPCPYGEEGHCMNKIPRDKLYNIIEELL